MVPERFFRVKMGGNTKAVLERGHGIGGPGDVGPGKENRVSHPVSGPDVLHEPYICLFPAVISLSIGGLCVRP